MSSEAMKVLPPKTHGPSQGCLQMSVKTIRWFADSPGQVIAVTSWWGDNAKYAFLPKDENLQNSSLAQNKSYVFNICSSKEQFLKYLEHQKRLKFMILKRKRVIGIGVLENLSQIYNGFHHDDYVDIYDPDSNVIADLHVCFNLQFFESDPSRNFIRGVGSNEDDLQPRRAVFCFSQAEKPKVESLQKISDLEPRSPVYGHLDASEKMLQLLQAGKENSSLLDITSLRTTDESDETKCGSSTLSSILSSTSLKHFLAESTSQCVLDYVTGKDTSAENELKILDFLRSYPLDPTQRDIMRKIFDDPCPRKGLPPAPSVYCPEREFQNSSQWSGKRSSPVKTHSTTRFSASSNSNSNANLKTPASPPTKNKLSNENSPSKTSGVSSKINFYRISLDRIIFNTDGLRKLHGCGNVKGHQENNCPQGKYIIQYQLSKIDPKFLVEKSNPFRHSSKKTLANGVIFGENDVFKVHDLRSDDIVTGFKISCQFLNQRLPMLLGETESLIINETSKRSLYIKSLNGLTIGKLDIQVDVASSVDTLPPPETFSEMCKEEIDELIPSSSFENFRAKSNNSKYLTLRAHLRNSSNERLKNVPSAQYKSFLDSYSSLSKDLSESAVPQRPDFNSLHIDLFSDLSSDVSSRTSEQSNRKIRRTDSHHLMQSVDNVKTFIGDQARRNVISNRSNGKAVLKELSNAAPLKYAIITHEFYVNVKNLDHNEEYTVNYVFPEGTADESGKVTSKWAVTSILTNLSRPFFISLPYGVSLKNFLTKTGKGSVSFFFKQPFQKKTIAKAVLDFQELYSLEKAFKSAHKESITKTISLPLIKEKDEYISSSVEIHIEYCYRICKYANEQDAPDYKSDQQLSGKSAHDFKNNRFLPTIDLTESTEDLETAQQESRDSVAAKILNTTFCISKNETGPENRPSNPDHDRSEIRSANEPLVLKAGGDFQNVHGGNLSTVFESSEPNKNFSKKSYSAPIKNDPTVNTQDVFYPNKEFIVDDLQSLSQLKLTEADHAQEYPRKETQENLCSKSVLNNASSHSVPTTAHLGYTQNKCTSQSSIFVPNTNLTLGDEFNFVDCKADPKEVNVNQVQAVTEQASYNLGSSRADEKTHQNSFIVPNPTPAFSDDQIYSDNVAQPAETKDGFTAASRESSDSGIRTKDKIFENYDDFPKSDFFKMGPVMPDRENDAIPSNNSGQIDSDSTSTCRTETHLNVSLSDDSIQTLDQSTRRRNSDSGYLGISTRDLFEPSIKAASRNQFSSEPNIYKPPKIIPPMDDFGITLRNKSQDRCFIARIGIVRSLNIPMIRLKGTKELTQPSTYVTFSDCFKRLHSSGTVVNCLIPEYDSRHKAWLSTELLRDTEERLTFQVWCKRYQNEWAGPDIERDRCLGFVHCNLSVLMHNFPYAGGWHEITSPSGKSNGFVQILVKPLQNIDFVRNLPCEELVYNETQLINDLQPYNYYLSAINSSQNDGISSKERLSQNITALEKTIQELQISHENRQIKFEERSSIPKNPPDGKCSDSDPPDKNHNDVGESCDGKIGKLPRVTIEEPKESLMPTESKSTARKLASFLSFKRKSKKHKSFPLSEDDSGSSSSGGIVESENLNNTKPNHFKNVRTPVLNIDNDSSSPTVEISGKGAKNVKNSPSVFARSFSFKLRKSGRKNKGPKNALLQTLPLYDNNLDKTEKPADNKNINKNFYISKANALYHSM